MIEIHNLHWGFQRVIQRAVFQVQSSGKTEVSGANILAAIFSEQESQSVYFIRQENISRLDVINFIAHGIAKPFKERKGPGTTTSSFQSIPLKRGRRSE